MSKRVVVLGGGGGAALSLSAVPDTHHKTAVIAVTDTGRSTGVARRIGGNMPAPGDIRSTIAATASDAHIAQLIQHRFDDDGISELNGMALGNLMLAALYRDTGDFAVAVARMNQLAHTSVTVLPVSSQSVQLCATLVDGTTCYGEVAVRAPHKAQIAQCSVEPSAPALPEAIQAIHDADLVIIGPGSFYTTIHAVLLFDGIREALQQTSATVVFVMNTTTQTGQTEQMDVVDHVTTLHQLVGLGVIDVTIVNTALTSPAQVTKLAHEGLRPLVVSDADKKILNDRGFHCLYAPVSEQAASDRALWNKQDTVRHDREALQAILVQLLA
ncbi:MAG: uridine diphosphate-N-acetylglucosamine-binding protein YvcK [Chloroflexota bacterium]